MKERPILFSGDMVRAILEGRKTQTRRVVKDPLCKDGKQFCVEYADDDPNFLVHVHDPECGGYCDYACSYPCPFGQAGDRLWVRETWNYADPDGEEALPDDVYGPRAPFTGCQGSRRIYWRAIYRATNPERHFKYGEALWRPSIHMPRWASRLTLEITAVRVERLQDISTFDAIAEGINCPVDPDKPCEQCGSCEGYDWDSPIRAQCNPRSAFYELWDSIHAKKLGQSWEDNPWVWVIEFESIAESINL